MSMVTVVGAHPSQPILERPLRIVAKITVVLLLSSILLIGVAVVGAYLFFLARQGT